jgi:hypothetical protein
MQLGETIATYDIALALRGENGKFEVTSPAGETYRVTCQPNHSISSWEWSGDRTESRPFLIRKVAEPVAKAVGNVPAPQMIEGPAQPQPGHTPFLLENHENGAKSSSNDGVLSLPKIGESDSTFSEILSLDLLYLEDDPDAKQPSACVCVSGPQRTESVTLMTSRCVTFNELDAEIRRLHAQLAEIRYRARKKFFETHSFAAGA